MVQLTAQIVHFEPNNTTLFMFMCRLREDSKNNNNNNGSSRSNTTNANLFMYYHRSSKGIFSHATLSFFSLHDSPDIKPT